MKLADARNAYYGYTESVSKAVRDIGFAGVAVVWVLRSTGADYVASSALSLGLWLFVATLAAHVLHYYVSSACWGMLHRHWERRGAAEEHEQLAPAWINWPGLVLFHGKVVLLIGASGCVMVAVWGRI